MNLSIFQSVSAKILCLIALVSMATISVAVIGIGKMAMIGHELTSITNNNIPLTKTVSTVTSHQLEQQILLERMLRMAGVATGGSHEELVVLEDRISNLTRRIEEELKESEALALSARAHAISAQGESRFESISKRIIGIEDEYRTFETHVFSIIEAIETDQMTQAEDLAAIIEEEAQRLDHELVQLQDELETLTLQASQQALDHEEAGIRQLTLISAVSILLGIAIALIYSRLRISRPLQSVTHALLALTKGDTSSQLTIGNRDEIGELAKAFETFKATMIEIERLRQEAIEEEVRIEQEKRDATLRLADNLESTVKTVSDSIADAVADLEMTASSVASTATQTSQRSSAVASAAQQSSTGIQSVAGASEELVSSIQEISRQVNEAMSAVSSTSRQASDSSRNVESLTHAAQRIEDVVNLINEIAEQTNLLALNATIEAARAGEAGKGFAVVAAEVKDLATQTAKATGDIRSQVDALQSGTSTTRQAIHHVVSEIERMREQMSAIASAVEEQSAVTNEIARNVTEVASGSEDVTHNIEDVSAAATSSSAAAEELRATIGSLSAQSAHLQTELDGFLLNIRAS